MLGVATLALALVVSGLPTDAVHLEDARGATDEEVGPILEAVSRALSASGKATPVVDRTPSDPSCLEVDRCVAEIRGRTGAGAVILLRLAAVPSRVRVIGDRVRAGARDSVRAEVDLPRTGEGWDAALSGFAKALLTTPPGAAVVAAAPADDGAKDGSKVKLAPWLVLGGSAVALGVAAIFGAQARAARSEAEDPSLRPSRARIDQLNDTIFANGLAANILFGAAIAGGLTSGALFLWD